MCEDFIQAKTDDVEPPVRSPEPLKIGHVVKLKSGGPWMTVNRLVGIVGDGDVWCLWFEHSGEPMTHSKFTGGGVNSGMFNTACLDVCTPSTMPIDDRTEANTNKKSA